MAKGVKSETRCVVGDCKRRKAPGFDRCPGHQPGVVDRRGSRRGRRTAEHLGPRFAAGFTKGFCPGCKRGIRAGQYVRAWTKPGAEYPAYVHDGCVVRLNLEAGERVTCSVEGCKRFVSSHESKCWIHANPRYAAAYERGVLRGRAMGPSVDPLTGEVSTSDPKVGSEEFEARWRRWMLRPDGAEQADVQLVFLGACAMSDEEAQWLVSKGWAATGSVLDPLAGFDEGE